MLIETEYCQLLFKLKPTTHLKLIWISEDMAGRATCKMLCLLMFASPSDKISLNVLTPYNPF